MNRNGILAALAAISAIFWLAVTTDRTPQPDPTSIPGTFANDCCPNIVLANGQITVSGGGSTAFTAGQDNISPYLIPSARVEIQDGSNVKLDPQQISLKIRLDRLHRPERIEIPGELIHTFIRQPIP